MSINLGPLKGGKHRWKMNNAADENRSANLIVNKPAFTYLAIEVMKYKRLRLITVKKERKGGVIRLEGTI